MVETDDIEPQLTATGRYLVGCLMLALHRHLHKGRRCHQNHARLGECLFQQSGIIAYPGGKTVGALVGKPQVISTCHDDDEVWLHLFLLPVSLLQPVNLVIDNIIVAQHTGILLRVIIRQGGVCPSGSATCIAMTRQRVCQVLKPFVPSLWLVTFVTTYPGVRIAKQDDVHGELCVEQTTHTNTPQNKQSYTFHYQENTFLRYFGCKGSANRVKNQRKTCFSLFFRGAAYLRRSQRCKSSEKPKENLNIYRSLSNSRSNWSVRCWNSR